MVGEVTGAFVGGDVTVVFVGTGVTGVLLVRGDVTVAFVGAGVTGVFIGAEVVTSQLSVQRCVSSCIHQNTRSTKRACIQRTILDGESSRARPALSIGGHPSFGQTCQP